MAKRLQVLVGHQVRRILTSDPGFDQHAGIGRVAL